MRVPLRLSIPVALVSTAMLSPGTAHAFSFYQFQSPSGNVFCGVGTLDDGNAFAQCEIVDRSWSPPPPPDGHARESGATGSGWTRDARQPSNATATRCAATGCRRWTTAGVTSKARSHAAAKSPVSRAATSAPATTSRSAASRMAWADARRRRDFGVTPARRAHTNARQVDSAAPSADPPIISYRRSKKP